MKSRRVFPETIKVVFAALFAVGLNGRADDTGGFFSIIDENDAWSNFFGPHQDRHYTHGSKLTWLSPDGEMPKTTAWLNQIPAWGLDPAKSNVGFTFGQSMFTPENILDPAPILTDRPYAGWLYGGMVFERRGELTPQVAVLESFEVELGLVGPGSLADVVQKAIHEWRFPEDVPAGWGNQIKNEPGLLLKYGRLWRWSPNERTAKYIDLLPRVGGELGNVNISGTAGTTLRLGWNLPDDFGVQIIDSPAAVNGGLAERKNNFSIYAFAGADGRLVAHDITLDGNSYQTSQSVKKYNFVNDLSWGLAVQPCAHFEISYVQITRSKEFVGQIKKDQFGSIDFKFMCEF